MAALSFYGFLAQAIRNEEITEKRMVSMACQCKEGLRLRMDGEQVEMAKRREQKGSGRDQREHAVFEVTTSDAHWSKLTFFRESYRSRNVSRK